MTTHSHLFPEEPGRKEPDPDHRALASSIARGGLTPWRQRRILGLLQQHLREELKLARLAEECRLSTSHFARAFKKSFGITVHQYLLLQRVEAAKLMLAQSRMSLTEVALETGFSDQAAFNRTFKAISGMTPGQWRRKDSKVRDLASDSSNLAA